MQHSSIVYAWERLLRNFFLLAGIALIAVAIAADLLGIGGLPGFGPNQISLALSGFAVLMTGVVLKSSISQRQIGEWLLVGLGVVAVMFAADLLVIGGLPGLAAKQIVLSSVAIGLVLTSVIPASSVGQRYIGEWLKLFALDKEKVAKFLSIVVQLGLLVLVSRQFQLENQAFYHNIMVLAFYGFLIHFFLPHQYRLPFFLFLSVAAVFGVLGLLNGAWLIAVGLGLIGICHLPMPFSARVVIILVAGATLAALRANWLQGPLPGVIWPILGSIFMFRLIIYLYDLNHQKEPVNIWRTLSYFFLLPNIVFPLFPPVDYKTFQRTYYDDDQYRIYQTGVKWMFWGVTQLIFYRFVNYYLAIAPEEVTNVGDLVRYTVSNLLLLTRVTGQFHLVIGLLHLFGFNLPRTNHLIFLASGFTDFWRRANIYWKDFMLKVFYYPAYFRSRKLGTITPLVLATLVAFVATWFLHAYQWFWLRGSFLLTGPDVMFWTLFAAFVLANTLYEARRGRKRSLGKRSWSFRDTALRSMGVVATFTTITILWSLWTSTSVAEWIALWSVLGRPLENVTHLLPLFLVVGILVGGTFWYSRRDDYEPGTQPKQPAFFKTAAVNGALILLIFLVGNPVVYTRLGEKSESVITDLRASRLSDRDAALLLRGYYEGLIGVNQFNNELWQVYTKRPSDWPLIQDTEAANMTNDFRLMELVPSKSLVFHGGQFTTNRWGMRDQDYDMTRPSDTFRVVLLGPSFVMGSGVSDDEVFESLLEDRINRENVEGEYDRYEILNFSVSGYSALQELFVFEENALAFEPNAVFFVAHQMEEQIVIRNLANSIVSGVEIPYDFLNEIARNAEINVHTTQTEAERRLKPYGAEIVSWIYGRITETAQERGIVPVWIFMPTLETTYSQEDVTKLTRLAEEAGFIILDLSDLYENQNIDSLVVAEWDRHPNAKGHKLIADRLYQALRAKEEAISLGVPGWKETP